jgi:multiple sugar transport system ATP-binding protein
MARVVLDHVHKVFAGTNGEEVQAVRDLCLAVEDKEILVLVGPSGSGKTTTLRLIAGLEAVSSGTISIDGKVVNALEPKDRDLAMVFQGAALYPHMTVWENLAFGLRLRRFPKAETDRRVHEAAATLGLTEVLHRLPGALSAGQRQRVALGRAMVRRPAVFLLDEPLSNLDVGLRAQMRRELGRLQQDLAATMIYVTHDQVEAMAMGSRIAVVGEGRLHQVADPLTLYHAPANLFVARFVGSPPMNFFTGVIERRGSDLRFLSPAAGPPAHPRLDLRIPPECAARLESRAGQPAVLGLRPEDILIEGSEPRSGAADCLAATVGRVELLGSDAFVYLELAGQACVARGQARAPIKRGAALRVRVDMARARLFDPTTTLAL